jgi:hypothetical protein
MGRKMFYVTNAGTQCFIIPINLAAVDSIVLQ